MNTANDRQVAGQHYKATYQHWDWVSSVQLSYLPAQVTKYLTRWKKKNGLQDLEKAKHFLDKHIEQEDLRRVHNSQITDKFTDENKIEATERLIIKAITQYSTGNGELLRLASGQLTLLIDRAKEPA